MTVQVRRGTKSDLSLQRVYAAARAAETALPALVEEIVRVAMDEGASVKEKVMAARCLQTFVAYKPRLDDDLGIKRVGGGKTTNILMLLGDVGTEEFKKMSAESREDLLLAMFDEDGAQVAKLLPGPGSERDDDGA